MDGRGGPRHGTGPKPLEDVAPTSVALADPLAEPGDDLPQEQRVFWSKWAVLALEKGTLARHTVPAFELLCEAAAELRQTKETLDRDGRTFLKVTVDGAGVEHQELKAHPLAGHYRALAKAVEGLLGKFKLLPFGKAEPARARAKVVNPWQEKVG